MPDFTLPASGGRVVAKRGLGHTRPADEDEDADDAVGGRSRTRVGKSICERRPMGVGRATLATDVDGAIRHEQRKLKVPDYVQMALKAARAL